MVEERSRDIWDRAEALASIGSKLLVPIILVAATSLLSRGIQDRQTAVSEGELNRQWVDLALSVLQDEAMGDQHDIREWSVAVINHYMPSEIQLSNSLRRGLVDGSVTLPASTPWSIAAPEVKPIQSALNALGVCDGPLTADGFAGFMTRACISRFLDGAPDAEVQALLTTSPKLLMEWIGAGSPPLDWRERVGPGLSVTPVVEVMTNERRISARPPGSPAPPRRVEPAAVDPITRIQAALAIRDDCATSPDGVIAPLTIYCVADYLGDATVDEARDMLSSAPELLAGWIAAGAAPLDWRQLKPEAAPASR